jgi:hypothetical protein
MNFAGCRGPFATEPRNPVEAVWGEQVKLSGIRIEDIVPGGRAQVVLWWQALVRPDRDYSAFVHLVDRHGDLIVQHDKLPLNAFYPMRAWPLNADQRDTYPLKIPADADLNGAVLAIGLYDAQDELRLPVLSKEWGAGDHIRVPVASLIGGS